MARQRRQTRSEHQAATEGFGAIFNWWDNPVVDDKVTQTSVADTEVVSDKNVNSKILITKIHGPYKENNTSKELDYISRKHKYFYYAELNKPLSSKEIYDLKWGVSYDDTEEIYFMFKGGTNLGKSIRVQIQIEEKGKDYFYIYAYTGDTPNKTKRVKVLFKKSVSFLIGGAGDKNPFLGFEDSIGIMPTRIVENDILKPFNLKLENEGVPIEDYELAYLGYEEIYGSQRLQNNVYSQIGYDYMNVNIVGHSLGGWNGAHLSRILRNKGIKANTLITIDPVGLNPIVTGSADVYTKWPKPYADFWISIHSDPAKYGRDDLIADIGIRWVPSNENLDILKWSDFSHGQAGQMFEEIIQDNKSASDYLLDSIKEYLWTK